MNATERNASFFPLYLMALGAFAIGTEGFMIAGLLPSIAHDLSTTTAMAGQLVTIFALAYAVSSPVMIALTSHFNRRSVLIVSMAAFAVANVLAAVSHTFMMLAFARVLLAIMSGLYIPGALALASAIVAPERRGHGLAIVSAGTTIAIGLGVPLGAIIGAAYGWHETFVGVAILSAIATVGLAWGLKPGMATAVKVPGLAERFAVVRQPAVLHALLMTTLWSSGTYAVYTFLSVLLPSLTHLLPIHFGIVFFLWGGAAAVGLFLGGIGSDRLGAKRVIFIALPVIAVALTSFSLIGRLWGTEVATPLILIVVVLWGTAAWAVHPAQQTRLIQIGGAHIAPVALSLNASFLYLGFSLGAALGSFALSHGGPLALGWVGGLCEMTALAVMFLITRARVPTPAIATSL